MFYYKPKKNYFSILAKENRRELAEAIMFHSVYQAVHVECRQYCEKEINIYGLSFYAGSDDFLHLDTTHSNLNVDQIINDVEEILAYLSSEEKEEIFEKLYRDLKNQTY